MSVYQIPGTERYVIETNNTGLRQKAIGLGLEVKRGKIVAPVDYLSKLNYATF